MDVSAFKVKPLTDYFKHGLAFYVFYRVHGAHEDSSQGADLPISTKDAVEKMDKAIAFSG